MAPLLTIPDSARDVLVAVNPHARAGNRKAIAEELRRTLENLGFQVTLITDIDKLTEHAGESLVAGRLRAVVAAGGDGTVRLVAERTPPGTPIAVLPLGTENLLARYLELNQDSAQLARIISAGLACRFDAGQANGQFFTLMAGCGFDADVVHRLHQSRQGNIWHLSYAKPILDAIRSYEYPELRVHYALPPANLAAGERESTAEIAARWVFVVNLPRYAGGLSFAPAASGTDGLLDVCTFKEGSLWHGLRYLSGVMLGQHESMSDFTRVQTTHLRIESSAAVPFQLDGDPGGHLPAEIRVLPQRLKLLVSQSWAEKQRMASEGAQEKPHP